MIPLPPSIYLKAGAAVIALGIAFAAGYRVESWHCAAREKAAIEKAIDEYRGEVARAAEAAGALAKKEAQVREKVRVIRQTVEKLVPVYGARECLDPRGVQLVNESFGAAAAAGKPDSPVPAAGAPR